MSTRFSLPFFVRPSRPDPVLPAQSQDNNRPLRSSSDPYAQLDHPDQQTFLSERQRDGTPGTVSHDYVELLRGLVDVEANRNLALEFTGDDAGIVINTIAKVSFLIDSTSTHSYPYALPPRP